MKRVDKCLMIGLTIFFLTVLLSNAFASEFPEKNINFEIGYSVGGGNDIIARALAPEMEKLMGVKVIVSNFPGAGGSICAQKIAAQEPNYFISLYSKSLVLMQYTGYGQVNIADFTPIAQVVEDTAALFVPSDAPYNTLPGFIAYAKTHPGEVKIANGGTGALWHLAAVQLTKITGIEVKHVPYKGGAPAVIATAAYEVEAGIANPAETRSLVETGDLKFLAFMSDKRNLAYPDVPTAKEMGVDFVFPVWRGIFTAAGSSAEENQILANYIKEAVDSDPFKEFMGKVGLPIRYRGPDDFAKLVHEEDVLYAQLLEELGLKISEPK